jgi:Tfp pilus assembly protein PilF
MPVNFCGQCGSRAVPGNRFCSTCGTAIGDAYELASSNEQGPRLRAALELLARRQPAEALAILDPLCAEQPDYAVARAYRGIAYLRLTRVADARDELEHAVKLEPESFICRAKFAEFLAQLGFYDQAVAQLDVAINLPPPDASSLHAALELRNFSREKAKGIYYRPLVYPKFSRLSPRGLFRRKALSPQGEH